MNKSHVFWITAMILITTSAFADSPSIKVWGGGLTLGSLIAVFLSWTRNKSILWAIVHFFLGWLYVIYYFFSNNSK
ncbi:hypothetical protein [Myroides odoratimimus]|uniref:hypothetical protein n=1 Tax=Myroides odoratimimus TaxID=76832 RepID=UPI0004689B54|nr:hypothetical protein [Myroides odoratimimus]